MKVSHVTGKLLPESQADFERLKEDHLLHFTNCKICGEAFGGQNTDSSAGWIESQISGICEHCWDEIFAEGGRARPEDLPF
jgi:hypothetical protein